jgi:hypothetical protein
MALNGWKQISSSDVPKYESWLSNFLFNKNLNQVKCRLCSKDQSVFNGINKLILTRHLCAIHNHSVRFKSRARAKTANSKFDSALMDTLKKLQQENVTLTASIIQDKAEETAKSLGINGFKASPNWLAEFKRRNFLSTTVNNFNKQVFAQYEILLRKNIQVTDSLLKQKAQVIATNFPNMNNFVANDAWLKSFLAKYSIHLVVSDFPKQMRSPIPTKKPKISIRIQETERICECCREMRCVKDLGMKVDANLKKSFTELTESRLKVKLNFYWN